MIRMTTGCRVDFGGAVCVVRRGPLSHKRGCLLSTGCSAIPGKKGNLSTSTGCCGAAAVLADELGVVCQTDSRLVVAGLLTELEFSFADQTVFSVLPRGMPVSEDTTCSRGHKRADALRESKLLALGGFMIESSVCRRIGRAVLCVAPLLFVAADWPQFRGPASAGVSPDEVPTEWDDTRNIVWKTELPGPGSSSPIVLGDRVYVTCYSGYGLKRNRPGEIENLKRHLVAVDRSSGEIVWDTPVAAKTPEQEFTGFETEHGYASSTPTTDGERLYVFYGRSGVYAFDMQGELLWEADVGTATHIWGTATSPLVHDDVVIVNASIESGSIVGLDKATGKEVWRTTGAITSWGSPTLVEAPAVPRWLSW